jgi:hypothetical protein
MTRKLNVSRSLLQTIVKNDLKLNQYKKTKRLRLDRGSENCKSAKNANNFLLDMLVMTSSFLTGYPQPTEQPNLFCFVER